MTKTHPIRKAAVIGSGTMGSGIAALLAGVGIDTVLLDIPAPDTAPQDPTEARNAIVKAGLARLQNARPPQLFSASDLARLRVGNLEDHRDLLADADWVIEVVVERLDIKRDLLTLLAQVTRADAIISTNTSGLPIAALAEGFDESFTRRFLGTHFFNPPRYLRLLEIIPHAQTDPAILQTMIDFGENVLGKGVVLAKDEPNFIGNRFLSMLFAQTLNDALDHGFTIDEVDALTGALIGRPKTGTFRLSDLIGTDIMVHIAENLYPAIPNDPAREQLQHPAANALLRAMIDNHQLGNKSGQGFYKTVKTDDGRREFWTLDFATRTYAAPFAPTFESVAKHGKVKDTAARLRLLLSESDRAAQFLWRHHAFYLTYAAARVPEITESLINIDRAQRWGFGHELGAFEIWDALGVADTIPAFESAGYAVPAWVKAMIAAGHATFYQYDAHGRAIGYYSPQTGAYQPMPDAPLALSAAHLRTTRPIIAENDSASLIDMGDDVALLELHMPANALDLNAISMLEAAADHLATDQHRALVIGSDRERFCIGANVLWMLNAAQDGEWHALDEMLARLQTAIQRLRYAPKPVVVAPFNLALGGGAELLMGGARVVSHIELNAGLVEFGVGVIPAGGGCKELVRRVINPVILADPTADVLPHLMRVFHQIASAAVSGSAKEAREMGFLSDADGIVMRRDTLLGEAKREALRMAADDAPMQEGRVWAAGQTAYHALIAEAEATLTGYDVEIARHLARVLTGGDNISAGWVDEQIMLNWEREAFLALCHDERTQARMAYMLKNNKPLKN